MGEVGRRRQNVVVILLKKEFAPKRGVLPTLSPNPTPPLCPSALPTPTCTHVTNTHQSSGEETLLSLGDWGELLCCFGSCNHILPTIHHLRPHPTHTSLCSSRDVLHCQRELHSSQSLQTSQNSPLSPSKPMPSNVHVTTSPQIKTQTPRSSVSLNENAATVMFKE